MVLNYILKMKVLSIRTTESLPYFLYATTQARLFKNRYLFRKKYCLIVELIYLKLEDYSLCRSMIWWELIEVL